LIFIIFFGYYFCALDLNRKKYIHQQSDFLKNFHSVAYGNGFFEAIAFGNNIAESLP